MNIETVDDLANQVADWIGCYGCCPKAEKHEDCENKDPLCCRIGFMITFPDRIRAAVENEQKINMAGIFS